MSTLLGFGRMAELHWREHRPKMVKEMESQGQLRTMLLEAQEKTEDEMESLQRDFKKQGMNPQQAYDTAWEIVREKYILLPAETE